jgi:dipeptidyl-peptidase-4
VSDTFPRQYARTQRYTLGEPRNIVVSPDGRRIVFARSQAGDDPVNCLWVYDVPTASERLVADPRALLAGPDDSDLPAAERARRERMRDGAGGVTAFATDRDVTVTSFALGGRLFVAGLISGTARELMVDGPVFDPRPDPLAQRVAYVNERTLRIAELDGSSWEAAGEPDPNVMWGSAEFIAAEEMRRFRGYWWSPDGTAVAVSRVDNTPVQQWHISDPADPASGSQVIRYPAAGTPNADVSLHVLQLDGGTARVVWDRATYPYLVDVTWSDAQHVMLTVQSRDQRSITVLIADRSTGHTESLWTDQGLNWLDIVPGTPARLADGRLVSVTDHDGAHRLLVDGSPITPKDIDVRTVAHVGESVVFTANALDDATEHHVWQWTTEGLTRLTGTAGVHSCASNGSVHVIRTSSLDEPVAMFTVHGAGAQMNEANIQRLTSVAEAPLVSPNVHLRHYGPRRLPVAVLFPNDSHEWPLPVLVDSYAGPHVQRVVNSSLAHATAQWFADQGFVVVTIDGRGTPGRGTTWERAVQFDLASVVLDDQVTALLAAADEFSLDLSRVAIRGWSFGGYLAALAVLRRPDVFHAAVAGAPVTDWTLYDTHYTERYLGDPLVNKQAYARSSLLPLAGQLSRPLLLVHGLADDNVVAAHSLQLSSALLAAGKPHEVLPLVGVSHMTPQEVVAENLLLHQLDFLRRALAG